MSQLLMKAAFDNKLSSGKVVGRSMGLGISQIILQRAGAKKIAPITLQVQGIWGLVPKAQTMWQSFPWVCRLCPNRVQKKCFHNHLSPS